MSIWVILKSLKKTYYIIMNILAIVQKEEVDLEYPKEWQQLHNNCPLAPDKIEILCID